MEKLHKWENINWQIQIGEFGQFITTARCSRNGCNCKLREGMPNEDASIIESRQHQGFYDYHCVKCEFNTTFKKSIEEKGKDVLDIIESEDFADAEIIKIDGDLIRVTNDKTEDDNYWIKASVSRDVKGRTQVMVLAGSKLEKDKTQLFLDISSEKLSFDQNDDHPAEIFSKVLATFKDSSSTIENS